MATARPRPQVMRLSEAAAARIKELMVKADRPIAGVKVGVKNGGCAGMEYTMEYVESIGPTDEVVEDKGVKLLIDPKAVLFLIGTALLITIVVEVLVVSGDIGRQNTIFKFYMQAWILLAVSAATVAVSFAIPIPIGAAQRPRVRRAGERPFCRCVGERRVARGCTRRAREFRLGQFALRQTLELRLAKLFALVMRRSEGIGFRVVRRLGCARIAVCLMRDRRRVRTADRCGHDGIAVATISFAKRSTAAADHGAEIRITTVTTTSFTPKEML